MSNSIVKKVKNNLDWCVKTTYSSSDDVNLGRCILHSSSLPCSNTVQGEFFSTMKLNVTFDYENEFTKIFEQMDLRKYITVYPVYNHLFIYKLHAWFSKVIKI